MGNPHLTESFAYGGALSGAKKRLRSRHESRPIKTQLAKITERESRRISLDEFEKLLLFSE